MGGLDAAGDEIVTARQLCGEPFWSLLDNEEKRLIGSCISHLVRVGDLPLIAAFIHGPGCPPSCPKHLLTEN